MELIKVLTNEKLRKKYANQFELVSYAIRLAENMLITGRAPRVHISVQNPALTVLEEIVEGKDQFEEVPTEPVERVVVATEKKDSFDTRERETNVRLSKEELYEMEDHPKRRRRILVEE